MSYLKEYQKLSGLDVETSKNIFENLVINNVNDIKKVINPKKYNYVFELNRALINQDFNLAQSIIREYIDKNQSLGTNEEIINKLFSTKVGRGGYIADTLAKNINYEFLKKIEELGFDILSVHNNNLSSYKNNILSLAIFNENIDFINDLYKSGRNTSHQLNSVVLEAYMRTLTTYINNDITKKMLAGFKAIEPYILNNPIFASAPSLPYNGDGFEKINNVTDIKTIKSYIYAASLVHVIIGLVNAKHLTMDNIAALSDIKKIIDVVGAKDIPGFNNGFYRDLLHSIDDVKELLILDEIGLLPLDDTTKTSYQFNEGYAYKVHYGASNIKSLNIFLNMWTTNHPCLDDLLKIPSVVEIYKKLYDLLIEAGSFCINTENTKPNTDDTKPVFENYAISLSGVGYSDNYLNLLIDLPINSIHQKTLLTTHISRLKKILHGVLSESAQNAIIESLVVKRLLIDKQNFRDGYELKSLARVHKKTMMDIELVYHMRMYDIQEDVVSQVEKILLQSKNRYCSKNGSKTIKI